MRKLMPMNEIVPIIIAVISEGGVFRLYIKGTSMLPLLQQGKDSVMLKSPSSLKKNDIILYRRANGAYVLHRIIKIKRNRLFICGDNQFIIEKGITEDDVIAKVVSLFKDEKEVSLSDKEYLNYVKSLKKRRLKKRLGSFLYYLKIKIKKGVFNK